MNAIADSKNRIDVLDSFITYCESGNTRDNGPTFVFLHGNPTSSYLWRNVIPSVESLGRCLAPDLIGMGDSGKSGDSSYRFVDHVRYLDAWFDAMDTIGPGLGDRIVLVVHDWGSALGFHWAKRHPDRIAGVVYMEAIVQPIAWEDFPGQATEVFQAMRSPAGETLVLDQNVFVEQILPMSILRDLSPAEHDEYRRRFRKAGEARRPTLTWPRELPIAEGPADVIAIVEDYGAWLATSEVPKLFIDAEPGAILRGKQREFCRSWPNQQEVTVKGIHFIQEDSPEEIGGAVADFAKQL